jgi:hypothetical protein
MAMMICEKWEECREQYYNDLHPCRHHGPHVPGDGCDERCHIAHGVSNCVCRIATEEEQVYAVMVLSGGKT